MSQGTEEKILHLAADRFARAVIAGIQASPKEGLTLRDYFAAHLAHGQIESNRYGKDDYEESLREIARNAYKIADAMLAEREKPT